MNWFVLCTVALQKTKCTANLPPESKEDAMKEITRIVVPVDLGKHTEILADYALYIGKKLSAHITFVHVTEFFETGDMMLGSPSLRESMKNDLLEQKN